MSGTLYIIGTPIGNLSDITFRAIETLKNVDTIICEDTRQTSKLLNHYYISSKKLVSHHANSSKNSLDKIIDSLSSGANCALVTDAGTPCISDPGFLLIHKLRTEFPEINIVPIPGPSALITALSASGVSSANFTFFGFLPTKKGRETIFKKIGELEHTAIFYESPHRILKTLESLNKFCENKNVVIGRELTKIFEEFVSGKPSEVIEYFTKNKDKVRGEFVVIVA